MNGSLQSPPELRPGPHSYQSDRSSNVSPSFQPGSSSSDRLLPEVVIPQREYFPDDRSNSENRNSGRCSLRYDTLETDANVVLSRSIEPYSQHPGKTPSAVRLLASYPQMVFDNIPDHPVSWYSNQPRGALARRWN